MLAIQALGLLPHGVGHKQAPNTRRPLLAGYRTIVGIAAVTVGTVKADT